MDVKYPVMYDLSFTHLRGFESTIVLKLAGGPVGFTHLRGFESFFDGGFLKTDCCFTHLRGFESQ